MSIQYHPVVREGVYIRRGDFISAMVAHVVPPLNCRDRKEAFVRGILRADIARARARV